jgi:hypothetical protein
MRQQRLAEEKHSSLLGKFIGYEENKVSSIQFQVAKIFFNLILK